MRRLLALLALAAATVPHTLRAQQPFTLQQILSAPYALSLTAAPVGDQFAWVENAEGVRNIWVGSAKQPARQLTYYTQDDGQDISNLAWSPDASAIAYTYGAESGASGRPASPAWFVSRPLHVWLQPLDPAKPAQDIGEGRAPLWMHGGCGLFFLRGGKVWSRGFAPPRLPSTGPSRRELGLPPVGDYPLLCETYENKAHLLIDERGSAHSLTLSPDGNTLAYISRRGGSGGAHSFLALFDTTALILSFPAPSTGNDSAPAFSPDGKQLAWLREPATQAPEFATSRISPNPWSIQLATFDEHPRHVTVRTLFTPEANKPGSVLPRMATGEPYLIWVPPSIPPANLSSRPERSEVERSPHFSGSRILFFSEADGWNHLYELESHAIDAKPVLLTPGKGEVEDVSVSPDGRQLFWATNVVGADFSYAGLSDCMGPTIEQRSAGDDRRQIWSRDLNKEPKVNPGPLDWDAAPKLLGEDIQAHPLQLANGTLLSLESTAFVPMHPVEIAEKAFETKDIRSKWLPATYPKESLVFPEKVLFPIARAGQNAPESQLHGQLFLPGNHKARGDDPMPWCNGHIVGKSTKPVTKHPAILFFHGGPKRQMLLGYPSMDYYSNAYAFNQYLASRGYIVLSVNYRGGIGYGLDFRQCEHCGADGAAEYADVLAARDYLASRPDVDAKRIGLWGGSYGGYLTALALARNSDLFAAGVDFHGVHEWAFESNAPGDWLDHDPLQTSAQRDAILARAHASSPMADIEHWRSPVLLIHGDDDPEVAYAQTPMLADALRARHMPVEELIFPDEVHGFLLHKDWLAAYQAASDFFDRTLK